MLLAYPDDPCVGIPAEENCDRLGQPFGPQYKRAAAYQGKLLVLIP